MVFGWAVTSFLKSHHDSKDAASHSCYLMVLVPDALRLNLPHLRLRCLFPESIQEASRLGRRGGGQEFPQPRFLSDPPGLSSQGPWQTFPTQQAVMADGPG